MPPPPQVCGGVHVPQLGISLPQPSPAGPQEMFCCTQVRDTQVPPSGAPHCPGLPPPPQVCGGVHVPQLGISLPQPSPAGPQEMFWSMQVMGVHVGGVGGPGTQEARSQIMYSRIFSCAVSGLLSHSAGKVVPGPSDAFATWKSLKMTCPHWFLEPTGVLNV